MWNGRDLLLKERLFGLTNNQGDHGEVVKEISAGAWAAARVARRLAVERRAALQFINKITPLKLPGAAGGETDPSVSGWTYWAGELPHGVLPCALALF